MSRPEAEFAVVTVAISFLWSVEQIMQPRAFKDTELEQELNFYRLIQLIRLSVPYRAVFKLD